MQPAFKLRNHLGVYGTRGDNPRGNRRWYFHLLPSGLLVEEAKSDILLQSLETGLQGLILRLLLGHAAIDG
jgi:hypothetical protein